ncbi:hypothetical protein TNCV_33301 [Trichonephila clavipes]|nr:hypothetical protein TNCV_33301 [Trichonephila clavipes]
MVAREASVYLSQDIGFCMQAVLLNPADMGVSANYVKVTRGSNTRAIGDGPLQYEPWASDEDDTGAMCGNTLSKFPHHATRKDFEVRPI